MKGTIMKKGGGAGKLFAAIHVTFPSGSTVTCTKGTKMLKAKPAEGSTQWVFAVPEEGTWTVTASKDTSSKSQSVEITKKGQLEMVTLSFEQILFDSSVTSGWLKSGHSGHSASIAGGVIKLTGDTSLTSVALQNIGLYYHGTKVTCTADMTLKVSVTAASCSYGSFNREGKAKLVAVSEPGKVDANIMDTIDSCAYFVASANIAGTGITSLSLPAGEYYLGIGFSNYVQLSADKVWIE